MNVPPSTGYMDFMMNVSMLFIWVDVMTKSLCHGWNNGEPCWQNESEWAPASYELQAKQVKYVIFGRI